MWSTDLAVIGAGPAGLAAALTAAHAGMSVVLLDERPAAGGQYLGGRLPPDSPAGRAGTTLLDQLPLSEVDWRAGTLVWDLRPDLTIGTLAGDVVAWLQARAVIVAGGARELVLPFPGWTLPGVMTPGAAQLLVKRYDVLPGRRVLLAGSGPLLLPAAQALAHAGATVVGLLETAHPSHMLRGAPAAWGNWDRLLEGARYMRDLRRAGVAYQLGWTVLRASRASRGSQASGTGQVESAVIAPVDHAGVAVPSKARTIDVDTLCVGHGLIPNVELTQVAGCVHRHDGRAGGWVPELDERLGTSVPGLYAAGETAGVGGAGAALVEGRMAALAAAARLGHLAEDQVRAEFEHLAAERRRLRRFGAMINTLYAPPAGLDGLATYDTPICRCEEVLAAELLTAIAQGARGLDELKTRTRLGQGPCQGRTCGPLAARLLGRQTGMPAAQIEGFRVRPPVKPVPLASLAVPGAPASSRDQETLA
jgi:NADPH-dependent 2,4-dienoyl-CoA reductase/sulfur reductase-like enzyme